MSDGSELIAATRITESPLLSWSFGHLVFCLELLGVLVLSILKFK